MPAQIWAVHCLQNYKLYSRKNINKLEDVQGSGSEVQNWALIELGGVYEKHRFLQLILMHILGTTEMENVKTVIWKILKEVDI